MVLTFVVIIVLAPFMYMCHELNQWGHLNKPEGFDWPAYSEFWILAVATVACYTSKILTEKLTYSIFAVWCKEQNDLEAKHKRVLKMCRNFWSMCYFICVSTYGYIVLKDSDWLPWYFGGNGSVDACFKGAPFVVPAPGSRRYALITMGYHLNELISHLTAKEKDNDFYEMMLHHFCAVGLFLGMIIANFLAPGCIIIFLHDFTDIFAGLTKFLSCTKNDGLTIVVGLLMMSFWFWCRNVWFTNIVYRLWFDFIPAPMYPAELQRYTFIP